MKTYLIKTTLGFWIINANRPIDAWAKLFLERDNDHKDGFLNREDLLDKGYSKIETTNIDNVFVLIKK